MADVSPTASAFRVVADDPEDSLTFNAKAAYTPALGDVVAISAADEVAPCDATVANGLVNPIGLVKSIQAVRTAAGAAGYRVTVLLRGLVEGFTGLNPGSTLYTSTTAGNIADDDPTSNPTILGAPIGIAVNATQAYIACPSLVHDVAES